MVHLFRGHPIRDQHKSILLRCQRGGTRESRGKLALRRGAEAPPQSRDQGRIRGSSPSLSTRRPPSCGGLINIGRRPLEVKGAKRDFSTSWKKFSPGHVGSTAKEAPAASRAHPCALQFHRAGAGHPRSPVDRWEFRLEQECPFRTRAPRLQVIADPPSTRRSSAISTAVRTFFVLDVFEPRGIRPPLVDRSCVPGPSFLHGH